MSKSEAAAGDATFSLFVRRLPSRRSFLVAAGLEDVLAFLERLVGDGGYVIEPSARLATLRRSLEEKAEKTEVAIYRD